MTQSSTFSSGLQLASFVISSDLLRLSWNALTSVIYSEEGGRLSYKVHSGPFHEKEMKIIAFRTIPLSQDHQVDLDLVSSSDLQETNFHDFDFLCTEGNPTFSINKDAISLLLENQHILAQLKDQIPKSTKLIVTGSGVAGSVASLFTLTLLDTIGSGENRPLCITFGAPLIGDKKLQQAIISRSSTWNSCFLNVVSHNDPLPSFFITNQTSSYMPFGTFLLAYDGSTSFEKPDLILKLLMEFGSTHNQNQVFQYDEYGDIVESLYCKLIYKELTTEAGVINLFDSLLASISLLAHELIPLIQAEGKIPCEDLENYLQPIAKLRSNIQSFGSFKGFKSSDGIINHANNLLDKAISKLEDEFKQLLKSYSKPMEPERLFDCIQNSMRPSSGSPSHEGDPDGKNHSNHHSEAHNNIADAVVDTPPGLIPPTVLLLLHNLAQQIMIDAGHRQQLLKIYRDARSNVLEESLQKLGVEKLNKDDVQKLEWEILESKTRKWNHYMRIAVKFLFADERKVCDKIFEGFDSLSEQCFADVTTNSVYMLLSCGKAFTKSQGFQEKLFLLLDMYEAMEEFHSEIKTLFTGKACTEIRDAAMGLTKRLAQTIQETIGDFEEAVEKDATAVTDETVHPLTTYVINYVKLIFDYRSTLMQLFQELEDTEDSPQLASVTMRIMQALQTNLDGKSKQYTDLALTHLFLMNNIHYIVISVRRSEAKDFLGDDWVQIHRQIFRQHANEYKRNAWAKILQCLSIQGLASSDGGTGSSSGASKAVVKERFKTFNVMFKELHQTQSHWTVPDSELRESLRLAVSEVLIYSYKSFVRLYGSLVESGKTRQKYIKYTAEDLERMLGDFFEGKNMNKTKR